MKPSKDQYAFRNFAERIWDRIVNNIIRDKGEQYTHHSNAFENFEHSAAAWDTHVPYEILQMAQKHWTFLVRWAKIGAPRDETMGGKARESAWDIVVYLLLLLFWLQTEGVISVEEIKEAVEEIKKKHGEIKHGKETWKTVSNLQVSPIPDGPEEDTIGGA